jgi:hypothetical protein
MFEALQEVVSKQNAKIRLLQVSMDEALKKLKQVVTPGRDPDPSQERRMDQSQLAEGGVTDCVDRCVSIRKGGASIIIIAEGLPFWEWAIGRFGVLGWTCLTNEDGHWMHSQGLRCSVLSATGGRKCIKSCVCC